MLNKAEFRGALSALGGVVLVVMLLVLLRPGLPGELLLQSLRFHIVIAGLGLGLGLMLLGGRWRGGVLLLLMLAAGGHGAGYVAEFQARRVAHADAPLAQFRFLSFNVLTGNARAEALVNTLVAAPPDVALVMETPGIRDHLDRLATVLPYRAGCVPPDCDISLHSRFPFEQVELRPLPPLDRQRLVIGRIDADGQKVTIVGVHLTKPHYDGISEGELRYINRVLNEIEGPVVLAGDFNAASWSDPVVALGQRQGLAPGPWQPATWPVRLGPLGVPIDNVFTRGAAQLLTLEAGDNIGSNHRPLWATVGLYGAE